MRVLSIVILLLIGSVSMNAQQDPWGGEWRYGFIMSKQDIVINYQPRKMNFITPIIGLFIPSPLFGGYYSDFNQSASERYSLMVYKSPIQHQAVFCRLEDLTQKRFGVMFQFHVGDYNSYMDQKIPR